MTTCHVCSQRAVNGGALLSARGAEWGGTGGQRAYFDLRRSELSSRPSQSHDLALATSIVQT